MPGDARVAYKAATNHMIIGPLQPSPFWHRSEGNNGVGSNHDISQKETNINIITYTGFKFTISAIYLHVRKE